MIKCPNCKRCWFEDSKSYELILHIGKCVGCINDKPYSNNNSQLYVVEKLTKEKNNFSVKKEFSKC